jgi:hypothetical protein
VGEPIGTLSSDIQTTGEAIYMQDLAVSGVALEGAYVCAQRPHARFDFSPLGGRDALREPAYRVSRTSSPPPTSRTAT